LYSSFRQNPSDLLTFRVRSINWNILNFTYSFVLALIRFFLIFESCVQLNSESKKPSTIIQFSNIPIYNIEVRVQIFLLIHHYLFLIQISRLLLQISFDNVCFTGCRFFKIKRGIFLSVRELFLSWFDFIDKNLCCRLLGH
jgi:hypothetical protein